MADTSIDRLTLDIVVNNDNATRRINSVTKAIEKLNTAVSKSGNLDKVLGTLNNVSPITVSSGGGGGGTSNKNKNWSEATYSIDKYGKKVLSQITTVAKFNGATSQSTKYFDEQGKQIREVINEIDQYGNKVKQVINMTDKKQPKDSGSSSGGMFKNLNIFSTLGKWNYYLNMSRYYARSLQQTVQYAMDYVETQNLWQVANRNNLEMADEFIQKMNKAYGISEQTLMNYQAIFKNMLSALGGISEEISSGLSMQLTQMAVDFSSLYNVSIPSAMQKFQAILSGQVRPIRSVSGYDITENTIFDLYQKAGGEKSMRQLSQLEKRLLRIVAVFDQMDETGALGDMRKTIESASNQARIIAEQTKETLTWTGQLMLMWINNTGLLQKVNAFLMTTKEIIKSIAFDLGYEEDNFLDGLMTSAEGADEAIDKLQGKLLSFDKFEALNPASDNALGLDQTVLDLLGKINLEMADFEMESTKLSNEWLKIIGYTYNEEKGIWEAGDAMTSLSESIKSVKNFVVDLYTAIKPIIPKLMELAVVVNKSLGYLVIALMPTIVKLVETLVPIVVDLFDVVVPFLNDILPTLTDIIVSLLPIINAVADLVTALRPLLKLLTQLLADIIKPIINQLQPLVQILSWIATGLIKSFTLNLNSLFVTLIPFVFALETILKLLQSIGQASADLLSLNWGELGKNQKEIWTNWSSVDFAKGSWNNFKGSLGNMFKGYATGGFPEDGFFYANSGELVGQFSNGKTAVANNEQIVQGITQGVYTAMMAYNAQTRGQGGSGDVYLDGTKVGKVVAKSSHKEMVRTGLVSVNA